MTVWLEGENGAVMSFSEPLPAVIAAQVARGTLRPVVAQTVPVVPDTAGFEEKLRAEVDRALEAQRQADADKPPADKPPAEPEPPGKPPGPGPVRKPSVRASAGAWRAYAVSQGMPEGKAAATTKQALIADSARRLRAVS